MRLRTLSLVVFVLALATPALAHQRAEAKAQVEFGILVAEKGLWRDATTRWEQAVKLDPTYAEAWNDLGVAYEQQGKFEDAKNAYEKAIKLQPDNQLIRQNYDLFREIYDRTKHRSGG